MKRADNESGGDAMTPPRPAPHVHGDAFCASTAVSDAVGRAAADRRMERIHLNLHMGGLTGAIRCYRDNPSPRLVVVESTGGRDELFPALEALAAVCDAGSTVVVIGAINDIAVYRDVIRRGVGDYLVAPVTPLRLIESLTGLCGAMAAAAGRSIVFVGARGGSGSSTLSHNLAWIIARDGRDEVALLDLDLSFGTAALDFDRDPGRGLAEALADPHRLDPVLLDRLLVSCSRRLKLLASPGVPGRAAEIDPDALDHVVRAVRAAVPLVVIDLPHLWSGWTRQILRDADQIVITAVPDLASLRNAGNIVEMIGAERPNDSKPWLILNQTGQTGQTRMWGRPDIPEKEFIAHLNAAPGMVLPFEPRLFARAAAGGRMLAQAGGGSSVLKLRRFARRLSGRPPVPTVWRTVLDGFRHPGGWLPGAQAGGSGRVS